jgi:hypothetical protein
VRAALSAEAEQVLVSGVGDSPRVEADVDVDADIDAAKR